MIRRKEDLVVVSKKIQGGNGEASVINLMQTHEFCGKGRLFSKIILKPGNSIGRHTHIGDLEAFYILKGEGKFHDDREEKRIYAGDLTLTNDGENHELINDSMEDLEMIALILYSK